MQLHWHRHVNYYCPYLWWCAALLAGEWASSTHSTSRCYIRFPQLDINRFLFTAEESEHAFTNLLLAFQEDDDVAAWIQVGHQPENLQLQTWPQENLPRKRQHCWYDLEVQKPKFRFWGYVIQLECWTF